jgi:hypothetical protein
MPGPANSLNITETGFQSFDGVSVFKGRTLTAGAGITISNGTGVSGDPTFTASGSVPLTFTGNSGVATPASNNLNIRSATTSVKMVGSGSTILFDFNLSTLVIGSDPPVTTATSNAGFGQACMAAVVSAGTSSAFGAGCMQNLVSGNYNTAVGYQAAHAWDANGITAMGYGALNAATTGVSTAFGTSCLTAQTTGASNTGVGYQCLMNTNGSNNTAIGHNAGINYVGTESSNILIGHLGTASESNAIHIGNQGSGSGQQLQTYIAGVINTVSGRVVKTTVPGAYPYTTLTTDYVILVDTSSARTINLIASPVTGTTYRIKDNVGTQAANNTTITPAAGTIDGAASLVLNTNWGSVDLCYTGSAWRAL